MSNYWKTRRKQDIVFDKFENLIDKLLAEHYISIYNRLEKQLEDMLIRLEAEHSKVLVSHLYQYDRYYTLMNEISLQMHELGEKEIKTIEDKFVNYYEEHCTELDKSLGLSSLIDVNKAKETINEIWCADNKSWSDRIWTDKDALAYKLRQSLVDIVTTGRSHKDLSKEIAQQFSTSFSNAERLVRTELAHIQTQSTINKLKEAGITKLEILSEKDCCDECADKKIINIEDAEVGVNLPPYHP